MQNIVFRHGQQARSCRKPEQKMRKPYKPRRMGDSAERREACLSCDKTNCKGWCEIMRKL